MLLLILFALSISRTRPFRLSITSNRIDLRSQTCIFAAGGPRTLREPSGNNDPQKVEKLVKLSEEERLQKILSRAGLASRRAAEKLILDGRVTVNSNIVMELGFKANPRKDQIMLDGVKVVLPDKKDIFWLLVNKPKAVLTTVSDDKGRESIMDLVPRSRELRLLPVGRLERDTTGAIILTNDNGWIHPLTHPSHASGLKKRYECVVRGCPSDEALGLIRSGFTLKDENFILKGSPIEIIDVDRSSGLALLDIITEESVPRQIQRVMDQLSLPLVSLKRVEFGPIKLKGLKKGHWRELSVEEIQSLKDCCS